MHPAGIPRRAPPVDRDAGVTTLVPSGQSQNDDLGDLRSRMAEREALLGERAAEIDRWKAELAAFKVRYRQEVGLLHEQLDDLEDEIAAEELGEINRRLEEAAADQTAVPGGSQPEPEPRFTSDAVRRLFRDVAKAIHPDLARDEQSRDRRHTLMIEANRAYALGDEERLRWILEAWDRSPEAVMGNDPESVRLRLVRRIAQIEEQLELCASDLETLKESPLWKLKAMVDEAAARGKDLISDTVRRLKRDIMAARNRLDAMRLHP